MFRLARFGFCFVRRGGIFSEGGGGTRAFLDFHRSYPSPVIKEEIATFDYNVDQDWDKYLCFRFRAYRCPIRNPLLHNIKCYRGNINWKELLEKCLEIPSSQRLKKDVLKTYIVGICESENLFGELISFFKYIVNNGEMCVGSLYLLCSVIKKHPDKMEECMDIVYDIYRRLPLEQELPMNICLITLHNSKKYKEKLIRETIPSFNIMESKVMKYIDNNDIESAVNILGSDRESIGNFLLKFITYFQNLANSKVLPVSGIELFLDMLVKTKVPVGEREQLQLNNLITILQNIDDSYKWCYREVPIGDVCKVCSGKLKKVEITDEEIEKLKENFKKYVIFGTNINIRSSQKEWDTFLNYINKKFYDIVIDGLNVKKTFLDDPVLFSNLLKKLSKLELTPLILARQHFCYTAQYKMVQQNYPVFLTDNLSHDDVFVIYAALHKGRNCFFLSADQMGFAGKEMQDSSLIWMYRRWQMLHQAVSGLGGLVLPHGLEKGFQKSPSEAEGEMRYHLVVKDGSFRRVYCVSRLRNNKT